MFDCCIYVCQFRQWAYFVNCNCNVCAYVDPTACTCHRGCENENHAEVLESEENIIIVAVSVFFLHGPPKSKLWTECLGGLPYLDVRAVIHLLYIFTYGRNALFNSFFAGLLGSRPNCSVPLWRCFESKKCCRKTRTCSTIVYSTVEEGLFQRAHTFWQWNSLNKWTGTTLSTTESHSTHK